MRAGETYPALPAPPHRNRKKPDTPSRQLELTDSSSAALSAIETYPALPAPPHLNRNESNLPSRPLELTDGSQQPRELNNNPQCAQLPAPPNQSRIVPNIPNKPMELTNGPQGHPQLGPVPNQPPNNPNRPLELGYENNSVPRRTVNLNLNIILHLFL